MLWLALSGGSSSSLPESFKKVQEHLCTLSRSHNLYEKGLGASKMKKSQGGAGFLFPTNEQASGVVDPGMGSLDYPSSRSVARRSTARGSNFAPGGRTAPAAPA
jgi:hypothetical protein